MENKETLDNVIKTLVRNKPELKGLNYFDVAIIVDSFDSKNWISSMNESYYEEVKKVLVKIAYVYCSIPRESMVGLSFDEIGTVIKRSYNDLTLVEVSLAFELAALNKTNVSLVSYGAGFTLTMVGDVLDAYRRWKGQVKWGLLDLSDKIKEIKEGIDDDGDIKIYTWWCNLLARIRGGEALPLWDRLPVGLVSVLNERGYLKFEGDSEVKKECYIKGIDLYIEELKREKKDVFLKSKVISLADKLALEKKVSDIDIWIENGRSLSRELIPEFLRIAGFGNGLKLLTIEYLKLIIAGKI